jgi:hypothetical protein
MHGADRDGEVAALAAQQFEDEEKDGAKVAKRGGRYVQSAFPGGPAKKIPGVMFGPRRFREADGLSTKAAPGPKGPDAATLIEEARQRRRARAEEERSRR